MLERFIASVNDVQKKLTSERTCSRPNLNFQMPADSNSNRNPDFSVDTYLDNLFEIFTLALACDQSRMISFWNLFGALVFEFRFYFLVAFALASKRIASSMKLATALTHESP